MGTAAPSWPPAAVNPGRIATVSGPRGKVQTAPDHAYYQQVKDRLSANRATLSTARKLARHARHVLVELGEEALAPVGGDQLPPLLAVAPPEAA